MAQQTINVGTSPNDGTGTPLRTAFQYTNSNFSELYTAVGPSGNNIVVPGTATITGALTVGGATSFPAGIINTSGGNPVFAPTAATNFLYTGSTFLSIRNQANTQEIFNLTPAGVYTFGDGAGGTRMTLNSTGLGVGATPSNYRLYVSAAFASGLNGAYIECGEFNKKSLVVNHTNVGVSANLFEVQKTGTALMTLDASGNLLVGTTTQNGKITVTQTANANAAYFTGNSGNFLNIYGWNVDNTWNANPTAIFVGKQTSTSRSINAGGTVNASGADYAEYMTKASDFVLAKGDVAGIDKNGRLTNVFADAVSFVVKSTDPSYVGNDKWGVGLEGADLEAARQLVDRIAFAGQVPVNVLGAKAGDYIVPIVDGTGIKGQAVSNPTFEQYQLAVGKVISIDADGRARIIIKIA